MRAGVPVLPPGPPRDEIEPEGSRDVTRDVHGFTVLVRNELFRVLRALASRDFAAAAEIASAAADEALGQSQIAAAMEAFFAAHAICAPSRGAKRPCSRSTRRAPLGPAQVLLDPEGKRLG
jgi:hypothetical protein